MGWRQDYENNGSGVNTSDYQYEDDFMDSLRNSQKRNASQSKKPPGACYIATCVYGSYDCPEVWTLRRFRDDTLSKNFLGRLFIKVYYAISPIIVNLLGDTMWFKNIWKSRLDYMVKRLNQKGVLNTPYEDNETV